MEPYLGKITEALAPLMFGAEGHKSSHFQTKSQRMMSIFGIVPKYGHLKLALS